VQILEVTEAPGTDTQGDTVQDGHSALDFRTLFESSPGLFLVLDPDFRILAASDAYLTATMTKRDEIVGRGLFEVFPDNPDDQEATGVDNLRASLERARRDRAPDTMAVQKYDVRRPQEQGGQFEVRYWSPCNSPVIGERGELLYLIHQVEDVTEFVRLQEHEAEQEALTSELRERTTQMETEILRRSAELRVTNERLRAAGDAKTEFLSRMSHELRTPLASILGFSELLEMEELGDEKQSWVKTIHRAGEHLLDLVNEVLDISRIESGHLSISLEPVSLKSIVEEALALMRPLATSKNVRIHALASDNATVSHVVADAQRLKQVLINLLSNAIKYNRKDGDVRVTVEEVEDGRCRIAIEDTGLGIAEDAIARLFVPFERLGAGASGIEGTGLGLALSRNIVEAMGGELTVASNPGTGATFSVELDRAEATRTETGGNDVDPALEMREYAAVKRLLYVEDVVANVRLVEAILRRRPSIRVIPAMQGQLGLELAREHHPDLILLDLHLPDIGGEEVLAQLQADENMRETPVVVLTADATERQFDQVLALGARDCLTKPMEARELLELVDRFMTDPVGSSRAELRPPGDGPGS
jgi:PAS domain S-box-containing protein